jgi:hypothetical protein
LPLIIVKPSTTDADVSPLKKWKPLPAFWQSMMQFSGPFSERSVSALPPKFKSLSRAFV